MLTKREKKWLEERKHRKAPCGAEMHHCVGCLVRCGCSLTPDLIDAAEFEARVAEKLAGAWAIGEDMCFNNHCQLFDKVLCTVCYLKNARIAVEQEMDNERSHA